MTNATISFPTQAQTLKTKADAILSAKPKLNWQSVDIDTLPHELRQAYDTYRAAQDEANKARSAFEDAIVGPLAKMLKASPGEDVVFTYRFGLGVALAPQRTAKGNALRFG